MRAVLLGLLMSCGVDEICMLPTETGPCEAAFEAWTYDSDRRACVTFTYGGCEGNENRFETEEECNASCNP